MNKRKFKLHKYSQYMSVVCIVIERIKVMTQKSKILKRTIHPEKNLFGGNNFSLKSIFQLDVSFIL